jgi:hypothetical protein
MSDFRRHGGRTHPGECFWGCAQWLAPLAALKATPSPRSYVQVPTWTADVPDGCTCNWGSDPDRGGWYLVTADPDCPAHAVKER